ncbi:hypothetical protein SEA_WYBORN_57 [Arthrobacter phage Wyborn]|uniref:Uncharacterized protein n=1 Tax=Arthrobacter phage Wyborn TaxID=3059067 RepID=A0AA96GUJ0_9CAUD|nr:hypothetical protein SEA_WYBORN_57 [Arthrobacter phage Wyborn]
MSQPPVRKVKITITFELQNVAAIPPLLTTDATPSELLVRVANHVGPLMRSTKLARWWRIDWTPGAKSGAIVSSKAGDKTRIGFTATKGWKL